MLPRLPHFLHLIPTKDEGAVRTLASKAVKPHKLPFVTSLGRNMGDLKDQCRHNLSCGNVVLIPGFQKPSAPTPSLSIPYVQGALELDVETQTYEVHGER